MTPDAASTTSHWFDGSIFGVLALGAMIGFWRGVIRQILWVGAVGCGGYVMWWGHRYLLHSGWQSGATLYAACGAAGIVTYWICRKIAGLLAFLAALEFTGAGGLLAGLLPSGALIWLLGVGLRWIGVQDHLTEFAVSAKNSGSATQESPSMWSQAKRALDDSFLGRAIGWLDPVTPEAHVKLAKLLILTRHPDAVQGMPNADVVQAAMDEPKVQALLHNARVRKLVDHRDFAALLNDPDLNAALEDGDLRKAVNAT